MHTKFADWYKTATFSPSLAELQARFAAVAAAAALVGGGRFDGFDLADALYGETRPIGTMTWFTSALKSSDPTILLDDNENTLRVLAGCTLAVLVTDVSADHSRIATAILAGTLGGHRRPDTPIPLVGLADLAIARLQISNRRAEGVPEIVAGPLAVAFAHETAEVDEIGDAEIRSGLEHFSAALQEFDARLARTDRQLALQREELNMLWWVLTGTTGDGRTPVSSLRPGTAALAIGWELASLTRFSPEPRAITAVISRALAQIGCSGPCNLGDAIEGLPPHLAGVWGSMGKDRMSAVPKLAILLTGVVRAYTAPENWRAMFERETGLSAATEIGPAALALQAFRERTLLEQSGT